MDTEIREVDTIIYPPKLCKKCRKEIKSNRKVFCSDKCAKAFHSLKRYHVIKVSPNYKQARKEYKQKIRQDKLLASKGGVE